MYDFSISIQFARQAVGAMVAMKSVIVTTVLSVILNQESVYAPQDGKVFPVKTVSTRQIFQPILTIHVCHR